MKKILISFIITIALIVTASALEISAKSAILYEANTGSVLYEKNATEKRAIASTTKIMTALLVIENCDLNEVVEIKKEQVGIEGTSLYLKEGERITVKTLLYGLMLRSGNDAAEALARHTSVEIEEFVSLMNKKAAELGMENTHFENPHGLPNDNHYSTAKDMAILTAYAMKNDTFKKVVSTKNYTAEGRSFTNHNKLLLMSEAIDGVKTGYTKAAGRCLVSSGEKEGMRLVAITLHAPNDWDDHLNLYNFGFNNFINREYEGAVAKLPVAGHGYVSAVVGEKIGYTVLNTDETKVQIYLPRFRYAPIQKGEKIGEMHVIKNDEILGVVDLVSDRTVELPKKEGFFKRLFDKIKNG